MTAFRDMPIRQKLTTLIIVIVASALVLSAVGIIVADLYLFRGYLESDLSTFARVIAENSTASLAFVDPDSARELLNALRARQHIVSACLYRTNGLVLAQYIRPDSGGHCPAPADHDGISSGPNRLMATRAVMLTGRLVGRLVILYDLDEMKDRIWLYGLTVFGVIAAATVIVLMVSSKLRTMFTTPILRLADTTARVSESRDYSVRAEKLSNDEVGNLVDGFNEMLAGIQTRDLELRESLDELRKSNEELARSNEDLERFAFVASHDLQEPLRMVTVYSQLLVREYGEWGEAAQYRDQIVSGTHRMRELLTDLLAYMEISAASEAYETIDLNDVIEKVKTNLQLSIEETEAIVSAAKLPVIRAHASHWVSLFQNLIGNSLKYRGDRPPRISVGVEDLGDAYRFSVADNGIGIEPEYHSKIFMAFKRLHGKSIPGTGIGLAICQRVVERYGGRIWVQSQLGKGATFLFTFPKMI